MLAIGGIGSTGSYGVSPDGVPLLLAHAAALSGHSSPRICLLNTAMGDDAAGFTRAYSLFGPIRGRLSHLELFPMPNVGDPADLLLSQDVIFVGGGSVANMLAVWRVHGLDELMRKAWESGIVLSGVSAGAICWFSGGTTDSFGPVLRPFTAGLGLLPGSYSPHYDSEPERRPLTHSLISSGQLPPGIACDDGAAAHFADGELAEIVAHRPGAAGYRVDRTRRGVTETRLDARLLTP